jgi:dienelactone hydrolase
MVPVTIDGKTVKLVTITYKPAGAGPFPTLIFHHGSTGGSAEPAVIWQPYDPKVLVGWFTVRGWAVVLPQRRGRGGSHGAYEEGISCMKPEAALAGAERGLRDIDAITAVILAQPFVDRSRVAVGGHSRGGILSVAWSGRQPAVPRAVINFVGGWLGSGCWSRDEVNPSLFKRGAAYGRPTIWLYGDKDPYYPLWHSRDNFAAFQAAGGKGTFHEYAPSEALDGHRIASAPSLWSATLDAYLADQGLPARAP